VSVGDEGREEDRRFMALALALGRRGLGRTWPNPAVGAPPRRRSFVTLLLVLGGVVTALWPVAGLPIPGNGAGN